MKKENLIAAFTKVLMTTNKEEFLTIIDRTDGLKIQISKEHNSIIVTIEHL